MDQEGQMDREDAVFAALADRTRRRMLDRLFESPGMTLNDLVANLDMRRQSASRHLKVLEASGLVVVQWQGREKRHYLNPVPIVDIERRWTEKFTATRAGALLELKDRIESEEGQ